MTDRIGTYRIERLLGRGGMGEVYRAYDEKLHRRVAIKLIRAHNINPDTLKRFRREARTAARLNHPAIVQIYHVEELEGDEHIVMELVEGRRLSSLVRRGPLDLPVALDLAEQIADGLAEAHAKGVVHRDLKAENIMVTADGRAKILDFGLALLKGRDGRSLETALVGTPRAMSPEQAHEQPLDERSDLFSFGTLLYEILTGKSPFRGRTPLATLHQISFHRPPAVRELNPEAPAELSALIERLHAKQPEDRLASAREVHASLESIRRALSAGAVDRGEQPLPLHGERRLVTLLCCSSAAAFDAAYFDVVTEVVERHFGTVVEMTPEDLIAVFGHLRTREDDAVRALGAAREILARLDGVPVRLGAHSGMVDMPRDLEDDGEHAELLDTASPTWALATAIRRRSAPGEIRISATTHHLVRDTFHCSGPEKNAGLEVELYRVEGRHERRGSHPAHDPSPLVGRRQELDLLQERWRQAREGRGQVVLLRGDAGIGKSRLVRAFGELVRSETPAVWSCRCSPSSRGGAPQSLSALLWQMLDSRRGTPRATVHRRLRALLAHHALPADRHGELTALLGLEEAEPGAGARPSRLAAMAELCLAMSEERPRIWVVEDLQGLDPTTRSFLDLLIERIPTYRLLLILTHRPEHEPPWGARLHLTPLVLGPLRREHVLRLIRSCPGGASLPSELIAGIVELTDGIPLFVEAITHQALCQPSLASAAPGIPTSLRGALLARLDHLGSVKQIAQLVAVFDQGGDGVDEELLLAVSQLAGPALRRALDRLVEAEILHRRGVARVRYVFRLALLRQAACESLGEAQRQAYRRQISALRAAEAPPAPSRAPP